MDRVVWDKILSDLKTIAVPDKEGFKPLDEAGGERHGSWVWTCFRRDEEQGITRYASLAITEEAHATASSLYLVEITAGADDSAHFHRFPVAAFRYVGLEALQENVQKQLGPAFAVAMGHAKALQQGDLLSTYPRAPFTG